MLGQQIKQSNGQYYLRSKFSIFENKDFAYPEGLLTKQFIWTSRSQIHFIESLRETVTCLRKRTLSNISKQLRAKFLYSKIITNKNWLSFTSDYSGNALEINSLLDLLSGIDANKSSSTSYCHENLLTLQTEVCLNFKRAV